VLANAEKAANRQYGEWNLFARLDNEIIDCADLVAVLVDDGAADNLRRAIACCQFLHIDPHERNCLRRPLRQRGSSEKKPAITIAPAAASN
jgi:hypothetical protein